MRDEILLLWRVLRRWTSWSWTRASWTWVRHSSRCWLPLSRWTALICHVTASNQVPVVTRRSRRSRDKLYDLFICRLWLTRVPLWWFLVVSTYNILLTTLERYAAVIYPMWYKANVRILSSVITLRGVTLYLNVRGCEGVWGRRPPSGSRSPVAEKMKDCSWILTRQFLSIVSDVNKDLGLKAKAKAKDSRYQGQIFHQLQRFCNSTILYNTVIQRTLCLKLV